MLSCDRHCTVALFVSYRQKFLVLFNHVKNDFRYAMFCSLQVHVDSKCTETFDETSRAGKICIFV